MIKNIYKLLFTLTLLHCGCRDKQPTRFNISQETKEFCAFRPGTWWVYSNKKNMNLDTWKVTDFKNGFHASGTDFESNKEYIDVFISTKFKDTFFLNIVYSNLFFSINKYFGINQFGYYDDNQDDFFLGCDNNTLQIIEKDSFENKCIRKHFKFNPNACTPFFPSETIWERNKGLSKLIYPGGDTLILESCNIVQ